MLASLKANDDLIILQIYLFLHSGVEIEGPIGVNITALEAAGVNLTELAETLRNDTEVDQILGRTQGISRSEPSEQWWGF